MATKKISFFSPQDNVGRKPRTTQKAPVTQFKGSINSVGYLKVPAKAVEHLGVNPDETGFLFGKGRGDSFFLVPTEKTDPQAFSMSAVAGAYSINLRVIFQKLGYSYADQQYSFTMKPFEYSDGVTGFELNPEGDKPRSTRARKGA